MSPLKLVFLFLCLRTIVSQKGRKIPENLDEAKSKDVFNCIVEVACIENKPLEVRKIADAGKESPELIKDLYNSIAACGVPANYDILESWYQLRDTLCNMTFPGKMSRFTDFAVAYGEYYQKNECEIPENESEYCIAFYNLFDALDAFIDKFTKLGVCNNPERMANDAIGGGLLG